MIERLLLLLLLLLLFTEESFLEMSVFCSCLESINKGSNKECDRYETVWIELGAMEGMGESTTVVLLPRRTIGIRNVDCIMF